MTMKTLSFQKETVRALVSVELDQVIGGVHRTVSSALEPTSTVQPHPQPTSTVQTISSVKPPVHQTVSSVRPPVHQTVSSVKPPVHQTVSSAKPPQFDC
jgi:hypothetical protein